MANKALKTIKDCHSIYSNGSHVLLAGKKCWLFRVDETFVAELDSIRYPTRIAFLPNDTALIDGDGDGSYHYISLDGGKVLWSSLKKGRRSRPAKHFAVSPDGVIVYDVYYRDSNILSVDVIVPHNRIHRSYVINDGLRVSHDIYSNGNGDLCILQSQINAVGRDSLSCGDPTIEQNGILNISINENTIKTQWGKQWLSYPSPVATPRGCNGHELLRSDFSILNLDTMVSCSLLEENELRKLPKDGFFWSYDPVRKLLTACFLNEQLNAIIDCQAHKVVGLYYRNEWNIGYQGCLIDHTFWMGTRNGIVKLPFPNV